MNKNTKTARAVWRNHPKLKGKFHPEYPDDVQVLVHDGGPRLTDHRPELVWVRVTTCTGSVFKGTVLNQPKQLTSIQEGSVVAFLVPDGGQHPLMVTEKYLQERPDWIVHPCQQCGLTELFDAPSDLMRVVFPDLPDGSTMGIFTAFCGLCRGVQVVQHKDAQVEDLSHLGETKKKWWQFWK
jgi:hypothetical protein